MSNFLGNTKSPDYKERVKRLLYVFQKLSCNMSVKVLFLHSHLDYFSENLRATSKEQGESFHQDIKFMEIRYQCRWNVNMMVDNWSFMRDKGTYEHTLKSKKRQLFQCCHLRGATKNNGKVSATLLDQCQSASHFFTMQHNFLAALLKKF